MKNITTIFIDIDNTLLDFNLCAEDSIKKGFNEWNIPYHADYFDVFNRINNSLWAKIEKKTLTIECLYDIRWQLIFDELGIIADGRKFEHIFRQNLSESSIEVEGALDLLKYLSKKYKIHVTSNAPHQQQIIRLKNAGMADYISEFFTSELIGYSKPSKEFFDECFKRLENVSKDEVILIGDSPTADIAGGMSYGIKTCWFNQNFTDKSMIETTFTISRLEEIRNFL